MIEWKAMRRPLAAALLCGMVATGLQGCLALAAGGTVVGTLSATDRRTLGAQTEDRGIMLKGETRIGKLVGDAGHVNVNSFNRKVLLTGEVRDAQMRDAAEREIAAVEGVAAVVNELEIAALSSLTSRSNDSLITGKVKASFVDAKDLFANSFKVVTERGTVYLMGRVTEREATRAAQVAAGVSGVRKVIKVFDYISEDELKQMSMSNQPQTR
ncbi:BON domain-containing protein [Janthinobacterium sp. 17J80-10]|uniref:BON domain-containing protein n=1 Tax=Janthinobacterium sp. 17J80-10 TaxID=2497863 RepID=UPI0010059DA6|nr:BON domain-containing protein [Janthinobacterium sp. 17J80-10]QAU33205.1 BON domain-containing protein [Janthinobacterium sp. 17J80-10]